MSAEPHTTVSTDAERTTAGSRTPQPWPSASSYLAVKEVFPNAPPFPAYAAVVAVVDVLRWVVLPELTDIAIVVCCRLATADARV